MDVLTCMSLGGSLVIAGYILFKHCKWLSLRNSWHFLLTAAGFFLIPYPLLLHVYLFPFFRGLLFLKGSSYILKEYSGEILHQQHSRLIISVVLVTIGFFAFFIRQFYLSKKYREKIEKTGSEEDVRKLGRKRIKILCSSMADEPVTMGVLHVTIVLPEETLKPDEREMVIRHELQHIKAGDMFLNAVAVILISLHWYNPLVYYMVREIKYMQELRCDFAITKNMNEEQRLKYSNLILAFARKKAINNGKNHTLISTFSGDKKRMWERMEKIMTGTKGRKRAGWILPVLTIICIFSSVTTTLAYDAPQQIQLEECRDIDDFGALEYEYGFFGEESGIAGEQVSDMEGMDLFVGENGEVFYCNSDTSVQPRITCTHTFLNGEYTKHIKNGDGCILEVHAAKRCTKCGLIVLGELLRTTYYTKCPH